MLVDTAGSCARVYTFVFTHLCKHVYIQARHDIGCGRHSCLGQHGGMPGPSVLCLDSALRVALSFT